MCVHTTGMRTVWLAGLKVLPKMGKACWDLT